MQTFQIGLLLYLLALFACPALAGEVYTWTDNQGIVHYSDTPGTNTAQIVNIQAPTPSNSLTASEQTTVNAPAQANQPPQPTPQQQQEVAQAQKQLETFCKQAQDNVALLQETGRRLYEVTPSGEYHYFTDEERQQKLDKTQADIKEYCKPTNSSTKPITTP